MPPTASKQLPILLCLLATLFATAPRAEEWVLTDEDLADVREERVSDEAQALRGKLAQLREEKENSGTASHAYCAAYADFLLTYRAARASHGDFDEAILPLLGAPPDRPQRKAWESYLESLPLDEKRGLIRELAPRAPAPRHTPTPQATDHAPSERRAYQALRNAAVMISVPARSGSHRGLYGSGFIFDNGRYFVSNMHVAGSRGTRDDDPDPENKARYVCAWGELPLLPLRASDTALNQDLVLRRIDRKTIYRNPDIPTDIGLDRYRRFEDLQTGEPLYTLGYGGGQPWRFSRGTVAYLLRREVHDEFVLLRKLVEQLQTGSNEDYLEFYDRLIVVGPGMIQPGNSGGAVVDGHGRLAGIVYAANPHFGFIIPIEYLFRLRGLPAPKTSPSANH